MSRRIMLISTLAAIAVVPVTAHAATCSFAAGILTVTGTGDDDYIEISATSGGALQMDGAACSGGPTQANTDTIAVSLLAGVDEILFEIAGGPFAPGATDESPDTSEIEVTVDGGADDDAVIISSPLNALALNGGTAGINLNGDADADDITLTSVEHISVEGGSGNDDIDLSGGGAAGAPMTQTASLAGNDGADDLRGGANDDDIFPADGADVAVGGAGVDLLMGVASDTLTLSDATMTESAGGPSDTHSGFEIALLFAGDAGGNIITATGFSGRSIIFGSSGPDELRGGSNIDRISGGAGNDRITGGAGGDSLYGGDGDDTFGPGPGNDNVVGGAGRDRIYERGNANFTVRERSYTGPNGTDALSSIELMVLTGGASSNTLRAELYRGTTFFRGGGGNDRLIGGAGRDTLWGQDGNDGIYGGGNHDALVGGNGTDYCNGGVGMDTASGCETATNIP